VGHHHRPYEPSFPHCPQTSAHYFCTIPPMQISYYSALFLTFSTIIGLWRPWVVLWWLPRQNRLMVLKWYGLSAVFFWLLVFFGI